MVDVKAAKTFDLEPPGPSFLTQNDTMIVSKNAEIPENSSGIPETFSLHLPVISG